jgi:pimeloyl-ACP methyl ester carboxylesterase
LDARRGARDVTGPVDEQPIYVVHEGTGLLGVLHMPARRRADVAVVFLSSGLQSRSGPHRIYVKAARRLAEAGFASLRLDLPGVGDSDHCELEQTFDCHDPDSVPRATDVLAERHGVRRVVLAGLCSGARVAIKAAARDRRVDGVIAWSCPIISGPVNMPVAKGGGAYMGATKAKAQLREWAPKLVNPAAWYKYLRSGKKMAEGWGMMRRALTGLLPERLRPKNPRQTDFFRSADAYIAARRKLLFVYGDDDKMACTEFRERFPDVVAGRAPACDYVIVPNGDHTFTRAAATDEVIARTRDWLLRHYPG